MSHACHAALVADLELATYVAPVFARVYVVPLALRSPGELHARERRPTGEPVVVLHAPSDPAIKGTAAIVRAVEAVARRHEVVFRLVTGAPHDQVLAELHDADLVVDQLNSVTSGVFALEAMALGRPVLGEIDGSALPPYQTELPVVRVTHETLERELQSLVVDPDRRGRLGAEGRAYVARNHDPAAVAAVTLEIYEHARRSDPGVYQATADGIVLLSSECGSELERVGIPGRT